MIAPGWRRYLLLVVDVCDNRISPGSALRASARNGRRGVALLLLVYGADMEIGVGAARCAGSSGMFDLLNRVKLSRKEKQLLADVALVPNSRAKKSE